jgi:hypothetical protein
MHHVYSESGRWLIVPTLVWVNHNVKRLVYVVEHYGDMIWMSLKCWWLMRNLGEGFSKGMHGHRNMVIKIDKEGCDEGDTSAQGLLV